jgi:hypothetical protein
MSVTSSIPAPRPSTPASAPETWTDTALNIKQYIDWSAVFAGNAVSGGLILIFLPVGLSAGLSLTSVYTGEGTTASTAISVAILWLAFSYLLSIAAGGYVAGRLRRRANDSNLEEVQFRDGSNGLVYWGVGMIFSALVTAQSLSSAIGTTATTVGQASGGAVAAVSSQLPQANMDYLTDLFLRSTAAGTQQTGTGPARSDVEVRAEIARILASSAASGRVSDPDRAYLQTLVAQRTGMNQDEASARVNATIERAAQMREEIASNVRAVAERVRSAAASGAFWTAVFSLLSGIVAVYAAQLGGRHRDENRY